MLKLKEETSQNEIFTDNSLRKQLYIEKDFTE